MWQRLCDRGGTTWVCDVDESGWGVAGSLLPPHLCAAAPNAWERPRRTEVAANERPPWNDAGGVDRRRVCDE